MIGCIVVRVVYFSSDELSSTLAPAILESAIIYIFGVLYNKLAYKLNDMENHRTDTEYNNHLIMKLFMFQFVNWYSGLFYVVRRIHVPIRELVLWLVLCGA
jgi:hypothetical protein